MHEWVAETADMVKAKFAGEGTGHDWWHCHRVWMNALRIWQEEGGDRLVIELAALLHDLEDWKMHDGDLSKNPEAARKWLQSLHVPENVIEHVAMIVANVTFKGAHAMDEMPTLEGKIVQDADRLDGIGAIGIARTFTYGGSRNRSMYDPDRQPQTYASTAEYYKNDGTTVSHFYEKLLLVRDRMHTQSARRLADGRHAFMEYFLNRFYAEWDGKL